MYESASRGPVAIETMPTPHLINAWRKLHPSAVVKEWMEEELRSRGCTYDADTGQWDIPKEPA